MTDKFLYPDLSYNIIGAALKVYNNIGSGLPEYCYKMALMIEFKRLNIKAEKEVISKVYYSGQQIGYFKSDIIIDNKIILELKSTLKLIEANKSQLLTYLKVTKLKIGYLLNFGNSYLEHLRLIL